MLYIWINVYKYIIPVWSNFFLSCFSLQNWVNPSYENVNHINQSWTLSDRFGIWVFYWSKVFLSVFWVQILNKLHWHSSRRTAPHLNKYRSKATNNNFMKGYLFSHSVIVQCLLVRIPLVQTTEVVLLYVKKMESSSGFSKIANKEAILLVQNLRVRFLIIYYHFSL